MSPAPAREAKVELSADGDLAAALGPRERRELTALADPPAIQAWLDAVPYSTEPIYRCPATVLRERRAHCFDGALLAAAALRRLGHRPRLIDLLPEPGRDDDHLLAVFRRGGLWGAVAKSNFVGLRYREPVYRGLRELAISYFEGFYNLEGEKTLRAYTLPLDLRAFDKLGWEVRDGEPLEAIARRLDELRRFELLPPGAAAELAPVDERSLRSGMLGTDLAGVFRPA
jgi:hypothetical protein